MPKGKHWLIVGSEQDPRVKGFQQALINKGLRSATVLDYQNKWETIVPDMVTPETHLRIESPGSNLTVIRELMLQGIGEAEESGLGVCSSRQIANSELEKGEFIAPHQFYFGLKQRLQGLQELLHAHPIAGSLNHIPDILTFFDKQQCHRQLDKHGIMQPLALYDVQSYTELREKMHRHSINNVFVKTRFGSAASGIIALRTQGSRVQAQTTIEQSNQRFYNTLRLQLLNDENQVAALIDNLCRWGVQCETWLPKAKVGGLNSDCRLLLVAGVADFLVLRKSKTPITNLHLLNERADISELTSLMNPIDWNSVLQTARKISSLFPHSFQLAIDLAVHENLRDHSVLELNAFGDFIQNIQHKGMNSYDWQLHQYAH